jgi:hypothetical protein
VDPITPGIISDLAANAVTGLIGQVARANARRKTFNEPFIAAIAIEIKNLTLGALSDLSNEISSSELVGVGRFLRGLEFRTFLHSMTVAVASGEYTHARRELLEEMTALLVLCAGLKPNAARKCTELLMPLFVSAADRTIALMRARSDVTITQLIDRAVLKRTLDIYAVQVTELGGYATGTTLAWRTSTRSPPSTAGFCTNIPQS